MANKRVKDGSNDRFSLLGLQNHGRWWLQSWKWKTIASWQESDVKPRQCLESRDITLLTKVCIVKAMVFPVITYNCESWNIKKAEHQKLEAFKLWCWRRLLKQGQQGAQILLSVLREINPEYSWKDWCWNWSSSILVIWCEQMTHWKSP